MTNTRKTTTHVTTTHHAPTQALNTSMSQLKSASSKIPHGKRRHTFSLSHTRITSVSHPLDPGVTGLSSEVPVCAALTAYINGVLREAIALGCNSTDAVENVCESEGVRGERERMCAARGCVWDERERGCVRGGEVVCVAITGRVW